MNSTPGKDLTFLRLAVVILAYFALWVLAPKAAFLPHIVDALNAAIQRNSGAPAFFLRLLAVGVVFFPTLVFMAVQFAVVYYFARLKMSFWRSAGTGLALIVVVIGLMTLIVARSGAVQHLNRLPTIRESLYVVGLYQGYLKMLVVAAMMLTAANIGYLVSLRVTDKNLLLPVVMFAAYIDLWTVTRGPVSKVIEKAPEVVSAVAAPIPQAGAGAFVPKFLIGPGDFLFAGLVFAVVSRLRMNGPRTFWFVLGAMALGMLAIAVGLLDYLPALIMLAVGVLIANWKEFKLSKPEIIYMVVAAVLLAATLPLVWSVVNPKPRQPKASYAGQSGVSRAAARHNIAYFVRT